MKRLYALSTGYGSLKAALGKYAGLVFICIALFSLQGLKAQDGPSPEDLNASLVVIFHHTFEDVSVTKPAQDTMLEMIAKAIRVYRQNESDETYSTIESNFQKLCDKTLKNKVPPKDENDPNEKPEINNNCINKAKESICPLWPFCWRAGFN